MIFTKYQFSKNRTAVQNLFFHIVIYTGTSIGPGKKKYDQIDKKNCVYSKSVKKNPKNVNNDPFKINL
jgi:hypothetical protein